MPSDWRTLDTLQENAWIVEHAPSEGVYFKYRQRKNTCFYPLARTASAMHSRVSWAKAPDSMPSARYVALNWSHQSGQSGWQGGNSYREVGLCIFDLKGCLLVDLVVHTSMEAWTNTLAEPLTDSTTVMPQVIDSQTEREEENIEVSFDGMLLTLRNGSKTRTYRRVRNTWFPEN